MKKTILLALIDHRHEEASRVQKIFTKYGCNIKTRLGIHDVSENFCSESGLIILELVGDESVKTEFFDELNKEDFVSVKKEDLELPD